MTLLSQVVAKLQDSDLHAGSQTACWDKLICAHFPLLSLEVLVVIKKQHRCTGRGRARRVSMWLYYRGYSTAIWDSLALEGFHWKMQRTINGKRSKGFYRELLWQPGSLHGSPSLTDDWETDILLTDRSSEWSGPCSVWMLMSSGCALSVREAVLHLLGGSSAESRVAQRYSPHCTRQTSLPAWLGVFSELGNWAHKQVTSYPALFHNIRLYNSSSLQ